MAGLCLSVALAFISPALAEQDVRRFRLFLTKAPRELLRKIEPLGAYLKKERI